MPAEPSSHRTYLVTGASSGIGLATARELATRGHRLVLLARNADALSQVAQTCERRGATCLAVPADVRDHAAVSRAFATATERFGPVDGVVHAAAVATYGRVEEVPPEVFDATVATTLLGTANVCRAAVGHFRGNGAGRLVVLGSVLGSVAVPYMGAYVASKWGVHGLVRTLQIETRRDPGIDVVLVSPGGVDTPIYDHSATYLGRRGRAPVPVQSPEEVARRVVDGLNRPQRHVDSGLANPLLRLGFRRAPALYDAVITPFMHRLGLRDAAAGPTPGNVERPASAARATGARRSETRGGDMGSKQTRGAVVSRPVAAPADAVWQVLCDGWTYANWVVGASRVRDVDPDWPAPGTRIHHAFGPWPLQIQDYTRVEQSTPSREAVLTARGWPLGEARVGIRIEPTGPASCVVSIEEDAVAGPGRSVPLALRQLAIVPRNKETLYRLALIAEGRYRNSLLQD